MTTRSRILLPVLVIVALFATSCGTQQEPATVTGITAYLPAQLGESGLTRAAEVRIFVGDSLYEYINGGAEMYHQYDFVEVATTQYRQGESEFIADIYRFGSPDNSFGMFSILRPEEFETAAYGAAGFADGPTVMFVKGEYMVNLLGYNASPAMVSAVQAAAGELNKILPGTADMPAMFSFFPADNRIAATEKIIAESYLGQAALTNIFTIDYEWAGDTVTLYMTDDSSGEKYREWSVQAGAAKTQSPDWPDCPYEDGEHFQVADGYYGLIIAGPKGGKLLGVVGYGEKHTATLAGWVNSITVQRADSP